MKNDEHGHFHRSFLCDKPHAVNVVAGQITRGLPLTLSRLNFFLHTFRGVTWLYFGVIPFINICREMTSRRLRRDRLEKKASLIKKIEALDYILVSCCVAHDEMV